MNAAALSNSILTAATESNPTLVPLLLDPETEEYTDLMRSFWDQATSGERRLTEAGMDPLEAAVEAAKAVVDVVRTWKP